MLELQPVEQDILNDMLKRRPDLGSTIKSIIQFHEALVKTYDNGGKLLICGNGGSSADSIHIVGELGKSFERSRPIPNDMVEKLKKLPFGKELALHLEVGFPAIAIGINPSLKSAIENDSPLRNIAFAQETYANIKKEDILLGISTSGNATNILMAMSVAKACDAKTVSLTGSKDNNMAKLADIAIKAPGDSTKAIQEAHMVIYHTICALIEAHYFPEMRNI